MRWVFVLACVSACDAVYGLEPRPATGDAAVDGQADAPSPDAPPTPHDEDGDGVDDATDLCPGLPDPGQDDEDSDGVGDVCDPQPGTANQRLLFDAFTTLSADWVPNTQWSSDGETVGPLIPQPAPDGFRLTHKSVQLVAGTPWQIDVGLELPATPPTDFQFIGMHLVDLGAASVWACSIYLSGGTWYLTAGANAVATSVDAPLALRDRGAGTMMDTNRCSVLGASSTTAMVQPQPYPVFPQLWTRAAVRYRFIDVIQ